MIWSRPAGTLSSLPTIVGRAGISGEVALPADLTRAAPSGWRSGPRHVRAYGDCLARLSDDAEDARVAYRASAFTAAKPVSISFLPADADTGIVFQLIDGDGQGREFRALVSEVGATDLCTMLGDPAGRACRDGRARHGRAVRARHRQCRRRDRRQRSADPGRQRHRRSSRPSIRPASRRCRSSAATSASSSRCASRAAPPGRSSGPMTAPASRSRSISKARRSAASCSPPTSTPTFSAATSRAPAPSAS